MNIEHPGHAGDRMCKDVAVPATYRGEWSLFLDWCAAFDVPALPADTRVVAHFLLEENPTASRAVLRRRVAAINHAHRAGGYPPPGTVTAVRRLLSTRRRDIMLARTRVRELPTSGWPAGLFGRRDALILWLTVIAGIPGPAIGNLRCGDITMADEATIRIGGGHEVDIRVDPDDAFGFLPVWRRWAQLRDQLAVRPAAAALVKPLTDARPVPADARPSLAQPPDPARPDYVLLPSFDQWGNLIAAPGDNSTGMTGRAVLDVVTAHLYRGGRGGRSRQDWVRRVLDRTTTRESDDELSVQVDEPDALPDSHDLGVRARRTAMETFDDIDEVYSDIDQRTADLLARTEALLEQFGGQ